MSPVGYAVTGATVDKPSADTGVGRGASRYMETGRGGARLRWGEKWRIASAHWRPAIAGTGCAFGRVKSGIRDPVVWPGLCPSWHTEQSAADSVASACECEASATETTKSERATAIAVSACTRSRTRPGSTRWGISSPVPLHGPARGPDPGPAATPTGNVSLRHTCTGTPVRLLLLFCVLPTVRRCRERGECLGCNNNAFSISIKRWPAVRAARRPTASRPTATN